MVQVNWDYNAKKNEHKAILKYKKAVRYNVGSEWYQIAYDFIYHIAHARQFWFTFCKYILKYASLGINGDHF